MITLRSGSYTAQLRDVSFPDCALDLRLNMRRDMDGGLWTTKRTPPIYTFDVDVIFLAIEDVNAFIDFIFRTMGSTYFYTDRDNVVWTVRLVTEPQQISDESRTKRATTLRMVTV